MSTKKAVESAEVPASALQSFCEDVAKDVAGEQLQEGERGFDFILILEIVGTIIATLIQKCPQPAPALVQSVRRPGLLQRVVTRKTTNDVCNCMGAQRFAGKIATSLLARGPASSEATIKAVVTESLDDANLLI